MKSITELNILYSLNKDNYKDLLITKVSTLFYQVEKGSDGHILLFDHTWCFTYVEECTHRNNEM